MRLPDFIHLGPPKTGTTALRATLLSHPGVVLSKVPEPSFFAVEEAKRVRKGVDTLERYALQYAGAPEHAVTGDISPLYLHSPSAPQTIHEIVPDTRLVVCLRHPVERAYSHYMMWAGSRRLDPTAFGAELRSALAASGASTDDIPAARFASRSLYYEALKRYIDRFGRDRVLVLTHDLLARDPDAWFRQFLDYVGAPGETPGVIERRKEGRGAPVHWGLHHAIRSLRRTGIATTIPASWRSAASAAYRRLNRRPATKLPADSVHGLYPLFREDVLRSSELVSLDLDVLWADRPVMSDSK